MCKCSVHKGEQIGCNTERVSNALKVISLQRRDVIAAVKHSRRDGGDDAISVVEGRAIRGRARVG